MLNRLTHTAKRLSQTAVGWGFAGAGIRSVGAVLLLPLLVKLLPSEELGVWYVFVSMSSLVLMLNTGLALSLTRGVAYLWTGARELQPFGISDVTRHDVAAEPNGDAIRDLMATLRFFYAALAAASLLLLATAGTAWIWHITRPLETRTTLRMAWLVYALGFSLNFSHAFWAALLSGINRVVAIERIMTAASVANFTVATIGLFLGVGVWSLVLSTLLMGTMNWVLPKYCFLRTTASTIPDWKNGRIKMSQLRAIWPTSWRTAACSVGAYLAMPATVIVSSGSLGLKATASFGLTLQLLTKMSAFSAVWIRVKLPIFSRLRAQGAARELAGLFAGRIRLCMLTALVGAAGIVLFVPPGLEHIQADTRLLPIPQLLILCAASLLRLQEGQYASLVLTENQNPFAARVLTTGVLVFACSALAVPFAGIYGVLLSMLLIPAANTNWSIVRRGIRGLDIPAEQYWDRLFLGR